MFQAFFFFSDSLTNHFSNAPAYILSTLHSQPPCVWSSPLGIFSSCVTLIVICFFLSSPHSFFYSTAFENSGALVCLINSTHPGNDLFPIIDEFSLPHQRVLPFFLLPVFFSPFLLNSFSPVSKPLWKYVESKLIRSLKTVHIFPFSPPPAIFCFVDPLFSIFKSLRPPGLNPKKCNPTERPPSIILHPIFFFRSLQPLLYCPFLRRRLVV